MGPRSYAAAVRAAGAVADAVERVVDGALDRAFCSVRPPGHHATPDRAMGFCLLNNVAVGAAAALARGLKRVAVIDFDVHHGNGTQEAFYRDRRVLFVSSHQFPFYPGTGELDEVGEARRSWLHRQPAHAGRPGRRGVPESVPRDRRADRPARSTRELVLVSAGFDAHRDDPLGGMDMTPAGFAELMDVCLAVASGPPAGAWWRCSRAATTSTASPSRPLPS